MSKVLWKTVKIDVPKEMVDISKSGRVIIKNTLTKSNNISKSNKEPSIVIKAKDIDKPKIENTGKIYDIKDLKERVKKANDLSKKNKGKEYKKVSQIENKILSNYKAHIKTKITDNKESKIKNEYSKKHNDYSLKELLVITRNVQTYVKEFDYHSTAWDNYYSKFKKDDCIKIINDFIKEYSFKSKTFFSKFLNPDKKYSSGTNIDGKINTSERYNPNQ